MKRVSARVLLAALFLAASGAAVAQQTSTDTFQVQITIDVACDMTASDLDFGTHGFLATDVDAQSALTVTCSNLAPYEIGLNEGVNGARLMQSGAGAQVGYELYTTAARTIVWDDIGGTTVVSGTGTGAAQTVDVFGRVPAQTPAPAAGAYTDTVTATIQF
jgi:spore coat protein U-like protein